jgi:hypothetical protein
MPIERDRHHRGVGAIALAAMLIGAATALYVYTGNMDGRSISEATGSEARIAAELEGVLPSTATVRIYEDQGIWGDVLVIIDSPQNMSVAPPTGVTFQTATNWWIAKDADALRAGFDHLLLCNTGWARSTCGRSAHPGVRSRGR